MPTITLLDDGRETTVEARVADGAVRIEADRLEPAIGWSLRAGGLCRGDVCIPVRDGGEVFGGGIDLVALAALLERPVAVDAAEAVVALGASAAERGARLRSLEAPEFTLPDLDGRPHALAELRNRKTLLLAWAGW